MTLLLGLLTRRCVAVAADGYSFRYPAIGTSFVEKTGLRKISISNSQLMVHAHCGWNELAKVPVLEYLDSLNEESQSAIAELFWPMLLTDRQGILGHNSHFHLWTASLDGQPKIETIEWDNSLALTCKVYTGSSIVWTGSGARYASRAYKELKYNSYDTFDMSVVDSNRYLEQFYSQVLLLQERCIEQGDTLEFGGDFHSAVVDETGARWISGGKAFSRNVDPRCDHQGR